MATRAFTCAAILVAASLVLLADVSLAQSSKDLSPCRSQCTNFPKGAKRGQCLSSCTGDCCLSAWALPGNLKHPKPRMGYCLSGKCANTTVSGSSNIFNMKPCSSCQPFPPYYSAGICLPKICDSGEGYLAYFAVVDGNLVPGGCPAGKCPKK